jgi:hypothetical protein
MNIYNTARKKWDRYRTGKSYSLYVRFSSRVSVAELAKDLGRKSFPDFGTDYHNSHSASWVYKNQSKNFMLELKRLLKKDPDIKEIRIREIKNK